MCRPPAWLSFICRIARGGGWGGGCSSDRHDRGEGTRIRIRGQRWWKFGTATLFLSLPRSVSTHTDYGHVVVTLFATFRAFTLNCMSCCDVLAEEESGCGGFDRNREPQQSGSEVQEGDADRAGWAQAVIEEREVCVLCQNTSVSHILSPLNGNLILKT